MCNTMKKVHKTGALCDERNNEVKWSKLKRKKECVFYKIIF